MGKREGRGKPLREILESFFIRSGWGEKMVEGKILEFWPEVVGKEISEKTQPFAIRAGVLQVRVPNSVWIQELHFFKSLILQKLNQRIKERSPQALPVKDLRFFLGERATQESSKLQNRRDHPSRELTLEEKERVDRAVVLIKDPELREAFLQVFSKGLRAERSRR